MAPWWILWSPLLASLVENIAAEVEMPYYLDKKYEKQVDSDDNKQALLNTRMRIQEGWNATYGVVMLSTSREVSYSAHTIPIWRAYCQKHGYDFFLQNQSLNPGVRDHWTKPRLLMELAGKVKWKYLWLVDANSLPMKLEKGWQYLIKTHMRHFRFGNDKPKDRVLWCPDDCDREAVSGTLFEGSCHGPHMSGCIWWLKGKKILPMVASWYAKRDDYNSEPRGLRKALVKTREGEWYDRMLWSMPGEEMGYHNSTFLATLHDDKDLPHSVRDQLMKTIEKHKWMGEVLNRDGEHKPEL